MSPRLVWSGLRGQMSYVTSSRRSLPLVIVEIKNFESPPSPDLKHGRDIDHHLREDLWQMADFGVGTMIYDYSRVAPLAICDIKGMIIIAIELAARHTASTQQRVLQTRPHPTTTLRRHLLTRFGSTPTRDHSAFFLFYSQGHDQARTRTIGGTLDPPTCTEESPSSIDNIRSYSIGLKTLFYFPSPTPQHRHARTRAILGWGWAITLS